MKTPATTNSFLFIASHSKAYLNMALYYCFHSALLHRAHPDIHISWSNHISQLSISCQCSMVSYCIILEHMDDLLSCHVMVNVWKHEC